MPRAKSILILSLIITIFWIGLLSFFEYFGDSNGWEGDDIAQLESIINFSHKDKIGVYKYYWQPLSYQLGLFLLSLFKSHNILFLLCHIFGATSICILAISVYIYSSTKLNPLLCFSFLIIFPELFFCGLYYNSTVLGMLPMSLSLLFLFWNNFSANPMKLTYKARSYLTCIFLMTACCFRIDYFFALPLTLYLLFISHDREVIHFFRALLLLLSGFVASLCLDVINVRMIYRYLMDYRRNHIEQTLSEKFLVSLPNVWSVTNIVFWGILMIFIIYFIFTRIKKRKINALLGIVPALVTIAPIYLMTTPKYLIPAIMFLPFFLAQIAIDFKKLFSKSTFLIFSYSFIFAAFLLQLVSLQVTKLFPYLEITSQPQYIGTHDGIRLTGAYLQGYEKVKTIDTPEMELAQEIVDVVEKSGDDCVIVSSTKGDILSNTWNWPWMSYYFQAKAYQVVSYRNNQEIILKKNNIVTLKRVDEEKYRRYQKTIEKSVLLIPIMKYDEEGYRKIEKLSKELEMISKE